MYITSAAIRHVLMNYVALLCVEVRQPWFARLSEEREDFTDDLRLGSCLSLQIQQQL
jgi:hypothetical protein